MGHRQTISDLDGFFAARDADVGETLFSQRACQRLRLLKFAMHQAHHSGFANERLEKASKIILVRVP